MANRMVSLTTCVTTRAISVYIQTLQFPLINEMTSHKLATHDGKHNPRN